MGCTWNGMYLQGVRRVVDELRELVLDLGPQTTSLVDCLLQRCAALHLLPDDVARKLMRDVALARYRSISISHLPPATLATLAPLAAHLS